MTVRAHFRFCPDCGRVQDAAAARSFRCTQCGYHYFYNTACAVAALIVCNEDLLVTVRAHEPGAGALDLPGGFIDPGESAEAALARELNEELGLARLPAPAAFLCSRPNTYAYDDVLYDVCDLFFLVDCSARPPVRADDDVAAVSWQSLGQLDITAFAMDSVRDALRWWLSQRTANAGGR